MSTTYNLSQVSFVWAGIEAQESGDDEYIEIEWRSEVYTTTKAVNGRAVRNRSNDDGAIIRLTLMATSPTNQLLSAALKADQLAGNGTGIASLTVRNRLAKGEFYHAASAWIRQRPGVTFSREVGTRVWEFECESLFANFAGH